MSRSWTEKLICMRATLFLAQQAAVLANYFLSVSAGNPVSLPC
jgi:hypothetical protein